jgi:hypothetical protein
VSVISAVGGIAVAQPSVGSENTVVGISIAFLVALFAIQRFGTTKISIAFAPSEWCYRGNGHADCTSHGDLASFAWSYWVGLIVVGDSCSS